MSHLKRQVVQIHDVSPDVLIVDASQARRSGDPQWYVLSVSSGKRIPGEAVSPVPPSLDMTVMCTSGVVPMSTQPPVVTSIPAMSTATVASREIDVRPGPSDVDPVPRLCPGSSDVDPVPRLCPASSSVGDSVPAVALSSPTLSGLPVTVLVGGNMSAIELSSMPLSEHTVPVTMGKCVPAVDSFSTPSSGQSSATSSQTLAWGDAGDSLVPLSPNRVLAGRSQDVPEEGSLFRPVSPGFLSRPSRDAQQVSSGGGAVANDVGQFQ